MQAPYAHPMMPRALHDEHARENFVLDLKIHMEDHVYPGDELVYESQALPKFKREHGRAPQDRHEVRKLMEAEPYTQMWSALARTIQEMLWDDIGSCVERQLPELIEKAKDKDKPLGSLRIDPSFVVPRYNDAVHLHCVPGGYHEQVTKDDVMAGAVYERGAYYYVAGLMGSKAHKAKDTAETPFMGAQGRGTIGYLKHRRPELRPKRILDIGCTTGNSTLCYVDAFPGAEIHAVDIAAPCLRYGHAKAEALGKKVHYSQQSGEKLDFEDAYFDVVVSHGLMHETSYKATRNILREVKRVLKPGGISAHADPQFSIGLNPYHSFMHDWDTHYNAEPFWGTLHDRHPVEWLAEAGFDRNRSFAVWLMRGANGPEYQPVSESTEHSRLFRGIIFGAEKA